MLLNVAMDLHFLPEHGAAGTVALAAPAPLKVVRCVITGRSYKLISELDWYQAHMGASTSSAIPQAVFCINDYVLAAYLALIVRFLFCSCKVDSQHVVGGQMVASLLGVIC